jgi:hypothetical protein
MAPIRHLSKVELGLAHRHDAADQLGAQKRIEPGEDGSLGLAANEQRCPEAEPVEVLAR